MYCIFIFNYLFNLMLSPLKLLSKLFYKYNEYSTCLYKITKYINKGSQGLIYKGINRITKKKRAFKILKLKNLDKKHIKCEKDLIRLNIRHPNIIRYHNIFKTKKYLYIVMSYYKQDLYDYVKEKDYLSKNDNNYLIYRKFNEKEIRLIIIQILKALSYLQKHNIYHTDLKIENILIKDINNIKLIDFTNYLIIKNTFISIPKYTFGTLEYLAPETYEGYYFNTSDIWSLGIIIYLLITNKFLTKLSFKLSHEKIIKKINNIQNVSNELKDLLTNMLIMDPIERITIKKCLKHKWFKK